MTYRTMTKPGLSIRALVVLAFLVALVMIATPAAADPGTGSTLDVFFAQVPLGDVAPECDWWWPWC